MDDRMPFDRPREADTSPDDHRTNESRTHLAALSERLKAQFDVELADDGLIVRDRSQSGVVVTITCRRRCDDGGRWWYFASCGDPIAEVERVPDTVVAIRGYLTGGRP